MKVIFIVLQLSFLLCPFLLAQEKATPQAPDLSTYQGLSGALESFPSELVVLDVRPQEVFVQSHLPKAINIPVSFLWYQHPTRNLKAVIVVYGRPASSDSRQAADILRMQGYQSVILFGSISKWQGPLNP